MNVLGIHAFYFNQAAALLTRGEISFFCEEEKLNRIKGQREGFPLEGIRAALSQGGICLDDVDELAYPIDPWRYSWTLMKTGARSVFDALLRRGSGPRAAGDAISVFPDRALVTLPYTPPFLSRLIRQRIRHGGLRGRIPPIFFVRHHAAHAASAFYGSGMDEATIVIVDGMGETESTTIWHGRGTAIDCIASIRFPNSLGEFYAAFTEFCGFKVYQQEGKLMGLAAYGQSDPEVSRKMDRVIQIENEGYRVSAAYTIGGSHSIGQGFSDSLVDLFGEPRSRDAEITDHYRQIAFAAQDRLERATLEIVRRAVRQTGCRKLCFSGGVAMNCKLNGTILHSGLVDDLYVLPASNDAGAALGAAMVRAVAGGDDPRSPLRHVYFGLEFDEMEIEATLKNAKARYRRIGEDADLDEVADLIASGHSVALYTGRNEFGARALGARSILADPRRTDMADIINERVKRREKWRPFAPVILEGHEAEYFIDGQPSRYMMKAFQVRPEKREVIPSVVHVDGTCRPQSISRDTNPLYHDILAAFHRKTGVPVLLNTSFNVRGEPIVTRPVEALRCYLGTGLDALVIGPFLLRKDSAA